MYPAFIFLTGAPMNTAVITVPSHFTQSDRLAILRVAELAGIEVLQLMNSNSAVALNYGVFRHKSFDANAQHFMFFDVGYIGTTATVVSYKLAKSREGDILQENPHMFVLGVGSLSQESRMLFGGFALILFTAVPTPNKYIRLKISFVVNCRRLPEQSGICKKGLAVLSPTCRDVQLGTDSSSILWYQVK
ncbi:unnamed protein product [Dibothriocephalus latus]|uniref:Hypoxia up-regulated protein 1 n=1 Tax=Dibothriocephalus latus TaxID=60516 RepID=A0A3P7MAR8_DIBLA|nr:unnamed protein product [Dibothriocephalus latus]